jgi:hypothetical protein
LIEALMVAAGTHPVNGMLRVVFVLRPGCTAAWRWQYC